VFKVYFKKRISRSGMLAHSYNLVLEWQKQEDGDFEASLAYKWDAVSKK
jgi:hypothetical protein